MIHDHPAPPPTTVLDVSDLLDAPGSTRQVSIDVPTPADLEFPLTVLGEEVGVEGVLESLVDGILLRGSVSVPVEQTCARCLEPIEPASGSRPFRASLEVAELYSDPAEAEEPDDVEAGYAIRQGHIDLDALIRDSLADVVDTAPKCRPDCAGLCPTCGINRNVDTCTCADETTDDRWAVLANLALDTGGAPPPPDPPDNNQ